METENLPVPESMVLYLNPVTYKFFQDMGYDMRYFRVLEKIAPTPLDGGDSRG